MLMSGFVSDSLKSDFTILRAHMMKKHMIKKSDSTQIATIKYVENRYLLYRGKKRQLCALSDPVTECAQYCSYVYYFHDAQ